VTRSRRPLFALFASDSISLTGNVVAQVAMPWFVLETTGSAALTGVTAFFTFLPAVIALFLGGAVVDRLGFARTSVLADLAIGVAVALIPVLHLTVGIELWQLIALVFAGALLDAPGTTAREALLPDVAELAGMGLEQASGINSAIHRGSVLVGAPVAGVLIVILGAANVLWLNAASFLASALLIRFLGPTSGRAPDAEPPGRFLGGWPQVSASSGATGSCGRSSSPYSR
jgi:MFS family permease